MRRLTLPIVAFALAAFGPLAGVPGVVADHSNECPPGENVVPWGTNEETYPIYLTADDPFTPEGSPIIVSRIYAESNGIHALQRDDDYCYTPGTTADTRDTIIW